MYTRARARARTGTHTHTHIYIANNTHGIDLTDNVDNVEIVGLFHLMENRSANSWVSVKNNSKLKDRLLSSIADRLKAVKGLHKFA